MTNQYSDDVLALNPDVARTAKKSRAVTPSGRGHGISDDAQKHERTVYTPDQRREMVRYAATWFGSMLIQWGTGTEAQQAALAAALLVELEASE